MDSRAYQLPRTAEVLSNARHAAVHPRYTLTDLILTIGFSKIYSYLPLLVTLTCTRNMAMFTRSVAGQLMSSKSSPAAQRLAGVSRQFSTSPAMAFEIKKLGVIGAGQMVLPLHNQPRSGS